MLSKFQNGIRFIATITLSFVVLKPTFQSTLHFRGIIYEVKGHHNKSVVHIILSFIEQDLKLLRVKPLQYYIAPIHYRFHYAANDLVMKSVAESKRV